MTKHTGTIYLPATTGRPAEPAPFLLTQEDAVRLLRLDGKTSAPYQTLKRYRDKGWLRVVQVGNQILYPLAEIVRFVERAMEENPR